MWTHWLSLSSTCGSAVLLSTNTCFSKALTVSKQGREGRHLHAIVTMKAALTFLQLVLCHVNVASTGSKEWFSEDHQEGDF